MYEYTAQPAPGRSVLLGRCSLAFPQEEPPVGDQPEYNRIGDPSFNAPVAEFVHEWSRIARHGDCE